MVNKFFVLQNPEFTRAYNHLKGRKRLSRTWRAAPMAPCIRFQAKAKEGRGRVCHPEGRSNGFFSPEGGGLSLTGWPRRGRRTPCRMWAATDEGGRTAGGSFPLPPAERQGHEEGERGGQDVSLPSAAKGERFPRGAKGRIRAGNVFPCGRLSHTRQNSLV